MFLKISLNNGNEIHYIKKEDIIHIGKNFNSVVIGYAQGGCIEFPYLDNETFYKIKEELLLDIIKLS